MALKMLFRYAFTVLLYVAYGMSNAKPAEVATAVGSSPFPPAAMAAILKEFPSWRGDVVEFDEGDVNGDSINDFVGIILLIENKNHLAQVVVLQGLVNNEFSVIARSATFKVTKEGTQTVSAKRNSIFVTVSAWHHSHESSITSYQFKLRDQRMALIGLETTHGDVGEAKKSGMSANFLTHKAITWDRNRGRRLEVYRPLRVQQLLWLEEFVPGNAIEESILE